MNNAIKKAIEGGWKYEPNCFLDPLFWQALGKEEGWGIKKIENKRKCPECNGKGQKGRDFEDCFNCGNTENNIDKIGYFKGKAISSMTREELLDFATYAGKELWSYTKYKNEHHELDLKREMFLEKPPQTALRVQCLCGGESPAVMATGYVGKFAGYVRAKGWSFKKKT